MHNKVCVGQHEVTLSDTPSELTALLLLDDAETVSELAFHLRKQGLAIDVSYCPSDYDVSARDITDGAVLFCAHGRLSELARCQLPFVVVGATNTHAIDAFAYGALGFVQYPFSTEKISECLQTLLNHCQVVSRRKRFNQASRTIIHQAGISREALMTKLTRLLICPENKTRLTLRSANAWICLKYGDVVWIEAAGDYLVVHCHSENHVVRCTLSDMNRKLDKQFIRINRSAIVNSHAIKRAEQPVKGTVYLQLNNDVKLKVSRQYMIRSTLFSKWL